MILHQLVAVSLHCSPNYWTFSTWGCLKYATHQNERILVVFTETMSCWQRFCNYDLWGFAMKQHMDIKKGALRSWSIDGPLMAAWYLLGAFFHYTKEKAS